MIYRTLIILSIILFASCENINNENPIPNVRVDFSINIMQEAPILDTQGGFFEMIKPLKYGQFVGYGGVVIFHTFEDKFVAFDMSCPHEAKIDIKIKTDMAGIARCDSCKTEFDLGFGSGYPIKGVSKYPLRKYNAYNSGYTIRVTN